MYMHNLESGRKARRLVSTAHGARPTRGTAATMIASSGLSAGLASSRAGTRISQPRRR